mgnify:FL=1
MIITERYNVFYLDDKMRVRYLTNILPNYIMIDMCSGVYPGISVGFLVGIAVGRFLTKCCC